MQVAEPVAVSSTSVSDFDEKSIQELSLDKRQVLSMQLWKKQAEEQHRIRAAGEALREKRESDERKALHRRWLETLRQKMAEEQKTKERASSVPPVDKKALANQKTNERTLKDIIEEREGFQQRFAYLIRGGMPLEMCMFLSLFISHGSTSAKDSEVLAEA